jgi:hypothetical protein
MSNTTKTLLLVVACVALTVPAWAQLNCPSEARNGCFEYDISNYAGHDVNGTGGTGSDGAVDHWTLTGALWSTDLNHTSADDGHSIKGTNCNYLWQIVDELKASWYVDEEDGWQHGTNPCWDAQQQSKTVASSFWAYFTEPWENESGQKINYQAYGWQGVGVPGLGSFDPADPDEDDWFLIGGQAANVGEAGTDLWQSFSHQIQINSQPQYVAWSYHFIDTTTGTGETDGPMYVDDVVIQGECADGGGKAPELGTWLLLACTGALGGVIRRRRKT